MGIKYLLGYINWLPEMTLIYKFIRIISFELISERPTSKSFHESRVKLVRIDLIDTFWRATTRELSHNLNRLFLKRTFCTSQICQIWDMKKFWKKVPEKVIQNTVENAIASRPLTHPEGSSSYLDICRRYQGFLTFVLQWESMRFFFPFLCTIYP